MALPAVLVAADQELLRLEVHRAGLELADKVSLAAAVKIAV
jgi:hypothetical protein